METKYALVLTGSTLPGFAPETVWIIGDNAGMQGTHAVADSWTARVAEVGALPLVTQPFDW